jgi:hypothetical protein
MANALRDLTLPVLDYFSFLTCREDGHNAVTTGAVLLLDKHKQSIAQCQTAVDGTTTSSIILIRTCAMHRWFNEPHRSLMWFVTLTPFLLIKEMHLWITLQPTFGTNFLKENWCFLNDNQQV